MPGYACHLGATVICSHAGQATPTSPFPRVTLGKQPIVTLTSPYAVAGCALTGTAVPPCATGTFTIGATRVRAGGAPVVIQGGMATCVPTGTPLQVLMTQLRVKAT
jgi:hypothetical protein